MTDKKKTLRIAWYDLAALVFGLALAAYFLLTVRDSVGEPDEASYYLLGHRLATGARMISDEWHLTQFGFLPTVPLYYLYTHFAGGTQGIVLFMRYAFIFADLAYFIYMYIKLRRFRLVGAVAAVSFCAMIPQTFLGFCYCTISLAAVMAICLTLFFDEKKKTPLRLFFVGVLLAVAVMENPFLVVLFLLWLVFVFVYALRRRSEKPFFNGLSYMLDTRAFLCIVSGCVVVFIVFIAILLYNHAFDELPTVLPYLFTGSEYNFPNLLQFAKITASAEYYSPVFIIGLVCCLIASAVIRFVKPRRRYAAAAVFFIACFMLGACFVYAVINISQNSRNFNHWAFFLQYHHFPLLLFSPVPFLLDPDCDRRRICMLITGLIYTVCMDIPSKSFLAIGAFLLRVPLILQVYDLVRSFVRAPEGEIPVRIKNVSRAAVCGISLCLCAAILWDLGYVAAEGVYKVPERFFMHSDQPMDRTLEKGPFKGLKTTKAVEKFYYGTLADLDRIREDPDCTVAVFETAPFAYMYLDRPYATFSPIYDGEYDRLSAYWKLPFTLDPDYLYVPYYNYYLFFRYKEMITQYNLSQVLQYVEGDVEEGEAGYIIHVRRVL